MISVRKLVDDTLMTLRLRITKPEGSTRWYDSLTPCFSFHPYSTNKSPLQSSFIARSLHLDIEFVMSNLFLHLDIESVMSNVFLHLDIEFVMSNVFLHLDIHIHMPNVL